MAELTQAMIDEGASFIDSNGIPMRPDGTPIRGWGEAPPAPPVGDTSAPLLAEIARQAAAANIGGGGDGRGGGPSGAEPPQDLQTINGEVFGPDPLAYNFGPYYAETPQDYPANRAPNMGVGMDWEQPGSWEQFHNPRDRSTGGGFFTANDVFPNGVPMGFQQGATRPSTNNYRLLPPGYNSPRYIMRNGYIIDLRATDLRGPGYVALEGGSSRGANWQHDPTAGFPADYSYTQGLSFYGWPGASNWASGGIGGDTY